jgi:hypothetical protein
VIGVATGFGIVLVASAERAARPLPRVATICRTDRPSSRCWTEPGEGSCAEGTVFRIVLDGPDVARALDDCRRPPDERRSQ